VGVITAFLTECFGLAAAFGFNVSDSQQSAIVATVTAASTLIVVMSGVIRQLVYAPDTTQKLVNAAESAGAKGENPPVTPV
jgi:hypothetical protein